jgi:hypothetical protein
VVLAIAACSVAAGCVRSQHRGSGFPGGSPISGQSPLPNQAPNTSGQGMLATDGQLARKEVAAKEEPATLIAADRSRCTVTSDRFKNTSVGSKEICDWRTGTRAP